MSASNYQDINIYKFSEDIKLAAQTMINLSDNYCRKISCYGAQEAKIQVLVNPVEAGIQSPTVTTNVTTPSVFTSRWVGFYPLIIADYINPLTQFQSNIDPLPSMAKNFVAALRRKEEDLLIQALGGNAKQGSGIGNDSFTQVPLPAGNIIPVDFGTPGTNTGMTLAKFRQAIKILKQNKAINGNMMDSRPVALFNAQTFDDLYNITQITSRDFNAPVLTTGMINSYMNVDIIQSENVEPDASGIIDVYMWTPERLVKGVWSDITTTTLPDPTTQANAIKLEAMLKIGYVRSEDAGVVKIRCQGPV